MEGDTLIRKSGKKEGKPTIWKMKYTLSAYESARYSIRRIKGMEGGVLLKRLLLKRFEKTKYAEVMRGRFKLPERDSTGL